MKDETEEYRGSHDLTLLIDQYRNDIDRLTEEISNIKIIESSHRELNGKLREQVREAEGELSIIKGIGNNSPEMRELKKRVEDLERSLSISLETNDTYQTENRELREDNNKWAQQISDLNDRRGV